ncbi:Trk system potassium uptake protein [Trypanosoma rangeli]|uniref:Trk system potassium uptake protein n=1 Tax=Trypanosoma rangeli TaxID=5698 RepID=A0A3R7RF53_TRYRA|nr:Trk system potassium uptake protein [Trypanosoma rangeli]RNF01461.1 Trk system potassium uptake protein [Trypanosoma rangeli]|eukprot:RNF01461.1 Trk system potassium uptake protein [Trypanosoma rangeli]
MRGLGTNLHAPLVHFPPVEDNATFVLRSEFPENGANFSREPRVTSEIDAEAATRSSQLLEYAGPVVLPLSNKLDSIARHVNFLKKWYLLIHVTYILFLVCIGSLLFYALEADLQYVDAFFVAMSSVCCCGLQTVDVSRWKQDTNILRHLLMIGGGVVFTSAHQPLLRIWMLNRMWPVLKPCPEDNFQEGRLRASRRKYAQRLWHTSVICLLTPLLYFVLVNSALMFFLAVFNQLNLGFVKIFEIAMASFHGSIFISMENYVRDPAVVLFVTIGSGLGFTLFPVALRGFFYLEWFAFRLMRRVCKGRQLSRPGDEQSLTVPLLHGDFYPLFAAREHQYVGNLLSYSDVADDVVHTSSWEKGFRDILTSDQPVSFHAFLFVLSETVYLGVAWCFITVVQAIPFWVQQWDGNGLLAPFSTAYKIFLSLCQAAVVRFAAASFVSCLEYSNAHIAITIICMFLPALPIPTDRTYRKWKQVFRTSMVRLLTSRLFGLFVAILCLLFGEEEWLAEKLVGSRFDAMTRSLFEVVSAFAGCGLSLSLPGSAVSFVGSLGVFSKLVVAAVILGGRHRTVDLGIDLGFAVLEADQRVQCGVG